ncbi:unnamed protein product [Lathyrus oleraceus]
MYACCGRFLTTSRILSFSWFMQLT